MAKRRENTHALHVLSRWIDREVSEESRPENLTRTRVAALADPDTVALVQTVNLDTPDDADPIALHVGYNLDGRMVRVVESRREPQEFKYLPHLFFNRVCASSYEHLKGVAERGGYFEEG